MSDQKNIYVKLFSELLANDLKQIAQFNIV